MRDDGRHLDLDLRPVFDQRRDLNGRHRRKMAAHEIPVDGPKCGVTRHVFMPVDDVPRHPCDVLGARPAFAQYRNDIGERLSCLRDEIIGLEFLLRIPADLSTDEDRRALRRNTVGVTPW